MHPVEVYGIKALKSMRYHENLNLENLKYLGEQGQALIEDWANIEGYEGIYEVSDLGRVKSLPRKTFRPLTGWGLHKARLLKQNDDGRGYLCVQLNKDSKGKTARTHQLVARAFLAHTRNGLVPNHKDFDKHNNIKSNLEIVTVRENSNHLHLASVSSFVGVDFETRRGKWRSRIHFEGKKKHLGYFDCEIAANEAYQEALKNINEYGRIKLT